MSSVNSKGNLSSHLSAKLTQTVFVCGSTEGGRLGIPPGTGNNGEKQDVIQFHFSNVFTLLVSIIIVHHPSEII